eukprot:sb/3462833/
MIPIFSLPVSTSSQSNLLSLSTPSLPLHSVDTVVVAKNGSHHIIITLSIQLTIIPRFTQIQTIIRISRCNTVGIIRNNSRLHIHTATITIPSTIPRCVHLHLHVPEVVSSGDTVGLEFRNGVFYEGNQELIEISKQPIRTHYLGLVTGYQPTRDQCFLIWSVPDPNILCAIHCDFDEVLANLTEYSYSLPVDANNLTYWRSRHLNFEVFGGFSDVDEAVITAGYYTADNQLVYGVTVDCAASTWTSTVTVQGGSGEEATFETGSVTCGGGTWDLWLKVEQPYLMNWIFNGTALHLTRQEKTVGPFRRIRFRPLHIPTKHGAHKGKTLKILTSYGANITRFTFGKCVSFPHHMTCPDAQQWVLDRSKSPTTLAQFGGVNESYTPRCVSGTDYYSHRQDNVHPDRNTAADNYCCCVDMVTGRVHKDEEGEEMCRELEEGECSLGCSETYQEELYLEAEDMNISEIPQQAKISKLGYADSAKLMSVIMPTTMNSRERERERERESERESEREREREIERDRKRDRNKKMGPKYFPCCMFLNLLNNERGVLLCCNMNCKPMSIADNSKINAKRVCLLLLRVPGLAYGKPTRDCRRAISPALEKSPPTPSLRMESSIWLGSNMKKIGVRLFSLNKTCGRISSGSHLVCELVDVAHEPH